MTPSTPRFRSSTKICPGRKCSNSSARTISSCSRRLNRCPTPIYRSATGITCRKNPAKATVHWRSTSSWAIPRTITRNITAGLNRWSKGNCKRGNNSMQNSRVQISHQKGEVFPNVWDDFAWVHEHRKELLDAHGECVILVYKHE